LLEALASGVPVAAHPVMGPIDVIGGHHDVGVLNNDLNDAIRGALKGDRNACRSFALQRSWSKTAELFIDNIEKSRATHFSSFAA
ncbi:MAG: glycosyltransferase family 1 protein, partial [Hyphomicrobiales bacterium]